MLAKTHVIGGIVIGLGISATTTHDPILMTAAAACGSLIPDIDHHKSSITRSNPFFRLLSALLNFFFTHRTFTHSLLFVGLVGWLLYQTPLPETVILGFLAGILSHLGLDAMTKNGIMLLYPIRINVRFPVTIKTGGPYETFVVVILTIAGIYFLLKLGGIS